MLKGSQPLDPRVAKNLGLDKEDKLDSNNREIVCQRMGTMFDDIMPNTLNRKPGLKTRLGWRAERIRNFFNGARHTFRNHRKWHKTMRQLRPWEGFEGLILVMLTQLRDYVVHEEKYGYSTAECKQQKITSAKEVIELLERMKEPDEYAHRLRDEVKAKYPSYQSLITKYKTGHTSFSGDFVPQDNGWAGIESGKDPREGYFELVEGQLTLSHSPDQKETDRLLEEIRQYHKDLDAAFIQAEADSDKDFEQLATLLKNNLYTWWD